MLIPFACVCGHRCRVKAEIAGKRIRCPGCNEARRVPKFELVEVDCPNDRCKKTMQLPIPENARMPQARCPACKTTFYIGELPAPPVIEVEEEVTGYGLAQESSVSYLLTRYENGHALSKEERKRLRQLVAEKVRAHPEQCPVCEHRWNAERMRCKACGFDLREGRRITKDHTPQLYATHRDEETSGGGGGGSGEVVGDVLGLIIEGLLS